MAACDYISLLCVSQPSSNPLFKGFGFRKVHTGELRPLKYLHLHSMPIRDLAFHPEQQDGLVVSASMDKTVKLTSLLVDQVRPIFVSIFFDAKQALIGDRGGFVVASSSSSPQAPKDDP